MGKEIERRFLLTAPDMNTLRGADKKSIRQGYFEVPNAKDSYRVRIIDEKDASHAVKVGKGMVRDEEERPIADIVMGNAMMNVCHHRVSKTRHFFERTSSRAWEVDVFDDVLKGIILAECELDAMDEGIALPSWFGNAIEVTDSLTNLHLARLATDLTSTHDLAVPAVEAHLASRIKVVVIAGPAGCGKTSLIDQLKLRYPDVHFSPEVASLLITQVGIKPPTNPVEGNRFQQAVYRTQKILERTTIEYAVSQGKRAVVFDRGTVDCPAYLSGGIPHFEDLCRTTMRAEYDSYDRVLFLGLPSKDVYDRIKANNPARIETYEQALEQQEKIFTLWDEHPHVRTVLDAANTLMRPLSWNEKVEKAVAAFEQLLS